MSLDSSKFKDDISVINGNSKIKKVITILYLERVDVLIIKSYPNVK
ncbi:hypothetical protein CHRYSEO8AT_340005 [Chryseobacterium sp. 8AT]|nr:hypothetical protein CHRYSEO8AT_340005 [Chryseobacterium sp. 8AT]